MVAFMGPLIAAGIGALAGELQGQKNRKESKRVEKERKKIAKSNLILSSYGLGQTNPNIVQGRRSGEELQGALQAAQFAIMNKDLWADPKLTPQAPDRGTMGPLAIAPPTPVQKQMMAMPNQDLYGFDPEAFFKQSMLEGGGYG